MVKFGPIYNAILIFHVCIISADISDKRLCANEDCTAPISLAKTILRYGSDDSRILSFVPGESVKIYSKSAGKKKNLWGAEINGKRGYVPLSHVKENKILTSKLEFEVNTEENVIKSNSVDGKPTVSDVKLSPDPVKPPYEVISGTTIYLNDDVPVTENIGSVPKVANDEQTKSNDIEPQNNENKSEESLVGNVFSSIANLLLEGSGLSLLKEEKNEDDNLDDAEIEDESDDDDAVVDDEVINNQEAKVPDAPDNAESLTPTSTVQLPNQETVAENSASSEINNKNSESLKPILFNNAGEDPNLAILHKSTLQLEQEKPALSNEPPNSVTTPLREVFPEKLVTDFSSTASADNDIDNKKVEHEVKKTEIKDTVNNQGVQNSLDLKESNSNKKEEDSQKADNSKKQEETDLKVETQNPPKSVTEEALTSPPQEVLSQKVATDFTSTAPVDNKQEFKSNTVNKVEYSQKDGKSKEQEEAAVKIETQIPEVKKNVVRDTPEKLHNLEKTHSRPDSTGPFHNADASEENALNNKNEPLVNPGMVNSEEVNRTDEPSSLLTTSDGGSPISSASIKHQIHTTPQIFSNVFLPSSESAEFPNINKDVIDNNAKSIANEVVNPTSLAENNNEISDRDVSQNSLLENEENKNFDNDNVIENINNERSGMLPDAPSDESNIKESEEITENIPQALIMEKEYDGSDDKHLHELPSFLSKPHIEDENSCLVGVGESDCPNDDIVHHPAIVQSTNENAGDLFYFKLPLLAYETLVVLIISAVTVVVFLWGYVYIDKRRKEVQLVSKINDLQKHFLILKKENELLTEKVSEMEKDSASRAELASNEMCEDLKLQLIESDNVRLSLELQIQNLEKELENSTEVGLELNRMLSEFLNSDNGSETLIANIDQLQRQLIEQQGTINTYNETISIKETENHELRLELEINNSRVNELQSELNKMALNLLKLEEDKEQLQSNYETDMASLKNQLAENAVKYKSEVAKISEELGLAKQKCEVSQRNFELKTNEYKLLKENINQVNSDNNNSDVLKSMFDATSMKAELLQLRNEKQLLNEALQRESSRTSAFEKQAYLAMEDAQQLKTKYDTADQERMEAQTKLEILSNYFKEREGQLQKELSKQESMWVEKQGEANSTTERIKYMQEELKNYKAQYESLKQEIVAQEVDMKSQISVLEKKAHENWVAARQAERKLDDAKQEAAQLRNRLTLKERNFNDDKVQNRLVSPLEQNGDLSLNDTGTSFPLLFGTREHMTTSPPLPSLPHFLPPPPGAPFMPPPLSGVPLPPPGFLPPPPSMIPGDHRPPPLGRMSSPPLNSRYSPDSMGYSHYSHNSPSPTSDDDYDRPVYRSYSPYNRDDRRDFSRPPPPPVNKNTARNHRGTHSSGSAHSNESLEKVNRHNSKV